MSGAYFAFGIGVVAFLFVHNGFPLPAAVLGVVLGPILEENFVRLTRVATDFGDMMTLIASRPIAIVLFALILLSILLQFRKPAR